MGSVWVDESRTVVRVSRVCVCPNAHSTRPRSTNQVQGCGSRHGPAQNHWPSSSHALCGTADWPPLRLPQGAAHSTCWPCPLLPSCPASAPTVPTCALQQPCTPVQVEGQPQHVQQRHGLRVARAVQRHAPALHLRIAWVVGGCCGREVVWYPRAPCAAHKAHQVCERLGRPVH